MRNLVFGLYLYFNLNIYSVNLNSRNPSCGWIFFYLFSQMPHLECKFVHSEGRWKCSLSPGESFNREL